MSSAYIPTYAPLAYSADPAVAHAPPVRTNPPPDPVVAALAALAALHPEMDVRDFRRLCGFRDGCDYYVDATNAVYLRCVRHAKGTPDALEDITSQTWMVDRLIQMNTPRT